MEDEDFSNAAPHLFGAGFEKRQRSVPKQLPAYERQAALTSRKWESTTLIGFSKNPAPVEEEAERMLAATVANTTRIANKGAFHQRTAQKGRPVNECPTLLHTECNVNTILHAL